MSGMGTWIRRTGLCLLAALLASSTALAQQPSVGEVESGGIQSLDWGFMFWGQGYYADVKDGDHSDLLAEKVEIMLDVVVNDWLRGYAELQWEEEDAREGTELVMDEVFVTLGDSEDYPAYLVAGLYALPVGNFDTDFFSEPLTLELAEVKQTSVMVGYANDWVTVNAGLFQGRIDEDEGDVEEGAGEKNISDLYASVTFSPSEQLEIGAYWTSDMLESDLLSDLIDPLTEESIADEPGYSRETGAGAFVNFEAGAFSAHAEFVTALGDYNVAGGAYRPLAANVEAAMKVAEKWTLGLKFEATEDFYEGFEGGEFTDKFAGQTYGAMISRDLGETTRVGVEYMHQEELGDDASGDIVALHLLLEI